MENLNAEQVKKELQEILDKFAGSLNRYYTLLNALRLINSQEQRIGELEAENERLKAQKYYIHSDGRIEMIPTAKGYRKQEDVLQELHDKVVKKEMEERRAFLEERKNVAEGDGVYWYIQGRIDGMEWVTDTVRFTKNKMKDQIAKEMIGNEN